MNNEDDKATQVLNRHMLIALTIAVVGTVIAALAGLTNQEGPSVISLLILAGIITATGVAVHRGVTASKQLSKRKG